MKSIKTTHCLQGIAAYAMLLVLLCCPATMRALNYTPLPKEAGSVLSNGVTYTVDDHITIKAVNTPGLSVAENATVTIYIPLGKKLIVKGGDAEKTRGAYAGIYVPATSTLIITGEGILEAHGGNLAAGGAGGDGGNGHIDRDGDWGKGGAGGNGGYGGGGAAPGIGGNGGTGASINYGPEGVQRTSETDANPSFDNAGPSGYNAVNAPIDKSCDMGKVYVMGSISIYAYPGNILPASASAGKNGNNDGNYGYWHNNYAAGLGGAGGGGGAGYTADYGIGAGAYGGQSGASGGAGGTYWKHNGDGYVYQQGGSGEGGYGSVKGSRADNLRSNSGGVGGEATKPSYFIGDKGHLYTSNLNNKKIGNRSVDSYALKHDAIAMEVTFDGNADNAQVAQLKTTVYLGMVPGSVNIPTRPNSFFLGYYAGKDNGVMVFDHTGKAVTSYKPEMGERLYAHWSNTCISTVDQFESLCENVKKGMDTKDAIYYLINDLDLSNSQSMLGTESHPFKGTFDGQGHTIKMNYDNKESLKACGLFPYVADAAIKNLNVTGSIVTNALNIGSIIGLARGVTIKNCMSDVTISSLSDDGYCGGIVGRSETLNITMENCAFTGRFNGRAYQIAGLVAFVYITGSSPADIKSCYVGNIFDEPSSTIDGKVKNTIIDYNSFMSIKNVFAHEIFREKERWNNNGGQFASSEDFLSGKLCYILNEGKANEVWYQNIGDDKYPVQNKEHRKVFYDLSSRKKESVYHNRNHIEMTGNSMLNTNYTPKPGSQIYTIYEGAGANPWGAGNYMQEYANKAYSYLYNNGNIVVENIPNGSINTHKEDLNNYPYTIKGKGKLYEIMIMENGILVHHFLPSRYNDKVGIYDNVENKFVPVNDAKVFLDEVTDSCSHPFTFFERSNGIQGTHCYICNKVTDPTYYVVAKFDGQDVIGTMGDQTLEVGDALKSNQYFKKLHLFRGWKAYDRSSKQIGKDIFANGEVLPIGKEFHDTLTFKAQWHEAFTFNGDTLLINDDNKKNISIVDNGINGFGTAKQFTADNISFQRTIQAGNRWGSLCLPFPISATDDIMLFTEGEITRDEKIGREVITLTSTQNVPAGTPCMYYDKRSDVSKERELIFTASNVIVVPVEGTSNANGLTFHGTLQGEAFKCDTTSFVYYGVQDNIFYNVGTSYVVPPYRMYMTMPVATPSGAKQQYQISFETDDVTGITTITAADPTQSSTGPATDLYGRRVGTISRPGIYIINRKKIFIK